MELGGLLKQLDAASILAQNSIAELAQNGRGPHFSTSLRTDVYSTQLGRLGDVDDALTLEVIQFYSDLRVLEPIFESVNASSFAYNRADHFSGQQDAEKVLLVAALRSLHEQCSVLAGRLIALQLKLPKSPAA